ncbi:MAG TPA: maleylpyruvate isomerase family mycothiol-dependent enzyme [Frankiaceae bacterium]|nr:maleylpyruvate isomerase family mycothiol-dependent enzyme [Frankiaceae bacterium]
MATSLATFVTALEQTWTSLIGVVDDLTEDQWHAPTELPGWTVKDNVSHVLGVELFLLGEPLPEHPLPDTLTHIRNDAGRWVEIPVDVRRPVPGAAVLAELRDVVDRRLKALRALDEPALDDVVTGVLGIPMPQKHLLGLRAFDSWTHEQDVRRALRRPGGFDTEAATLARRRLLLGLAALPFEAGRSVVFETADQLPSVATVTFGQQYAEGDRADADARITLDFDTFVRLGTGRAHYPDVTVRIAGDRAFAEDVLRGMTITP